MGRKWWIVVGVMIAALFWNSADAAQEKPQAERLPTLQTQAAETIAQNALEFPVVVKGTELIVQYTAQYEGPFLEDAQQQPISGVMALMVYNPGNRYFTDVMLHLQQGQRTLLFEITMLPPGSKVLVLEKSGQPYSEETVSRCEALCVETAADIGEQGIIVTEEAGRLVVTNMSENSFKNITLYYKQFDYKENFYLGGYTCSYHIGMIGPGECREVVPYRYVCGYSKVVSIKEEK